MSMEQRFEDIWKKWDAGDLRERIQRQKQSRAKYLELVIKYLPRDGVANILEVGCGSSIDLRIVAEETGASATGVDISEEALGIARLLEPYFNSKVRLVSGDARDLEFGEGAFDMVFSQGLIEHFKDPLEALREQVRVLKEGGILIVNVPQKYTAYTVNKHFMAMLGRWEWGKETEFSSRQLYRYGGLLGLEFLERAGYGYWLSPFEVVYVLRTLNRKMSKVPFMKKCRGYEKFSRSWDRMWERLEDKYGHFFMKNIIYVYRKVTGRAEGT